LHKGGCQNNSIILGATIWWTSTLKNFKIENSWIDGLEHILVTFPEVETKAVILFWGYHNISMKFLPSLAIINLRRVTYKLHKVDSSIPTKAIMLLIAFCKMQNAILLECWTSIKCKMTFY
jgi:hypothetical protein